MVEKAYPGTISSVILSVVVVMMLLLPFYVANNRDKLRTGEEGIEFKEVMCFDIDDEKYFWNDYRWNNEGVCDPPYIYGTGACMHDYNGYINGDPISLRVSNVVSLVDSPSVEGTVDGYGLSSVLYHPDDDYHHGGNLFFYLTLKKNDILDLDITRIDIYFDVQGLDGTANGYIISVDGWKPTASPPYCWRVQEVIRGYTVNVGELTEIEITVDDLLEINTMGSEDTFAFMFIVGEVSEGASVYFDMQFYHIEEIKLITTDYMGIAMTGGGLFMIFCSIIMLPHITFSRVMGKIIGKES